MPKNYDEDDVVIENDDNEDDNDACGTCAASPVDDESMAENFNKFMDDIIIKENRRCTGEDSPQRERARRHQERPLGRIRFGAIR